MQTRESNGIGFRCGAWPLDPKQSTLIFLHGSGGTNELWQGQVDALAERANTVALDLPGRGLSRGPGMRTVPEYAQAVMDFVGAIEAPQPIPCGLSLGGGIALQLLLDHPRRFGAGILIGTGARLRVMPAILEGIERDYEAHLSNLQLAASPRTDPEILKRVLESNARCPAEVALGDFQACDAFDVMKRLGEIDVPVLVVSGEDDRLTPPKYADFLEKSIRHARRAHVMDAGHLAPAEKPAEVNRAIVEFLDAAGL
jgi:pimeloyl-ACP methyl ester carboxylesterase